jgi:hypothetical protein
VHQSVSFRRKAERAQSRFGRGFGAGDHRTMARDFKNDDFFIW